MDVVLFRYNGRHVLHRIIRREGTRLYIRGDGSFVPGSSVRLPMWSGRYVSSSGRRQGTVRKQLALAIAGHAVEQDGDIQESALENPALSGRVT